METKKNINQLEEESEKRPKQNEKKRKRSSKCNNLLEYII